MSNRKVFATDLPLGTPTKGELDDVFKDIATINDAIIKDLQDMDVELRKAQHVLNSQAFVIDAMTKILVSKDICTAEELSEIMKTTHAVLEAANKPITGPTN